MVILSASVETFSVSRMRDFFYTNNMYKVISNKCKLEQQLDYVRMKQVLNIPEH